MVTVHFTDQLRRLLGEVVGPFAVEARSLGEALEEVFARHPRLRSYVLDDQGNLRRHVACFVDGSQVRDLDVGLGDGSEVHCLQALSGG